MNNKLKIGEEAKRIIFIGDSITAAGMYIGYLETYIMQHMQDLKIEIINFGLSSETASGLSEPDHLWPRPCIHDRIDNVLQESKPDIVAFCYGMNDGIYYPFSESRFEAYQKGIISLIDKIRKQGAKIIALTPLLFDAFSFKARGGILLPDGLENYSYKKPFEGYNQILKKYAEWIRGLDDKVDIVIDIYSSADNYINSARERNPEFISGDGIHPNTLVHWIITKTILKSLFNITLTRAPLYVNKLDEYDFVGLIGARHRMLSNAWKEHVGHTNPNKANALPLGEAIAKAADMENKIREALSEPEIRDMKVESTWEGYKRYDFYVHGREAILVMPENPAQGNPWVWRTEFFGAFAEADIAMLKEGWYLAYYRISDMYGSPEAAELMDDFYDYMKHKFNLSEKAVLFGFSRGGLYAYNYASKFPDKVRALYLDAPVLDIKSWPGGKGKGSGAPKQWMECKEAYGLTDENVNNFKDGPLDNIHKVADKKIPIIIVAGDADEVVPFEENSSILINEYKKYGCMIEAIVKPGVGHHPHSLSDPQLIVDFLKQC